MIITIFYDPGTIHTFVPDKTINQKQRFSLKQR
jgi:hypothetical protein